MVSGMTFDAARETIEQRVAKQLIGTRVSVTMGDLRSIRVFVLGEAEKPGSYTVSGLSTMTNALFVSGGVKKIGSLRNIELKRNGRLVTTLDLYDLLLHGDTSGDRQLLPGDVIFIPPIGNTVSVYGAVRRPAIYELKTEKTVEQAIELAGGLLPDADAKLGQLERILPSRLREMQNVDLSAAAGRATAARQRRQAENSRNSTDARELGDAVRVCVSTGTIRVPRGLEIERCPQQLRRIEAGSGPSLHHDSPRSAAGRKDRGDFGGSRARAGRARLGGRSGTASARSDHRVQSIGEPRPHPGADHQRSRVAGNAGQARTSGQHRWTSESAGKVSAGTRDARQRPDSRRRQLGGCGIPGSGGTDALRGGRRGRSPDRIDHGESRGHQARRSRRRFAAEALRHLGHQTHTDVDGARHHRSGGRGQIPGQVSHSSG